MQTNLPGTNPPPAMGGMILHPRAALIAAAALSAALSACAIEAPGSSRSSHESIGVEDCSHDVCEVGPPLDATCDSCTELVCSGDTFCCEVEWDDVCVQQAELVCGVDCSGATCGDGTCDGEAGEDCTTCPDDCGPCDACAHDLCEPGDALDPACDECVETVCNVDPFCCETAWDGVCVGEAETLCGLDCGLGPECGNGTCEAGEDCVFCSEDCGACPACPHGVCEAGGALPFGCDPCTPNVCKVDPFCCQTAWDSLCIGEAEEHCAVTCDAAK